MLQYVILCMPRPFHSALYFVSVFILLSFRTKERNFVLSKQTQYTVYANFLCKTSITYNINYVHRLTIVIQTNYLEWSCQLQFRMLEMLPKFVALDGFQDQITHIVHASTQGLKFKSERCIVVLVFVTKHGIVIFIRT